MKLSQREKDIVRKKFCVYCIKVLHGEALNYLHELNTKHKYEINFSEMSQNELKKLCVYDENQDAEVMYIDVVFYGYDRKRNCPMLKNRAKHCSLS